MPRYSLLDSDDGQGFFNGASEDAVNKPQKKSKKAKYNQYGFPDYDMHNSFSRPLPTKFRIENVVLDFGVEENADPMNILPEDRPMPAPNSSRIAKTCRLANEAKTSPNERKTVPKPIVELELPPQMASDWMFDRSFRPITPIPRSLVDDYDTGLPSSEDIWKSYMDVKMGVIQPSEAEWPLCCMTNSEASTTSPPTITESQKSDGFPPKNIFETGFERKIDEEEQRALDQWLESEGLNGLHNDVEESDSKSKVENDPQTPRPRILDNEDVAFASLPVGIEEERAIKEWIKSEGLNEPHSDIEEFNMLLSLARDHEKNRDLLFELLKPKDLISQEKDVWKKFSPRVFEMPQKSDFVEPELWKPVPKEKVSIETVSEKEPEKANQGIVEKPEKPVILEVKDIKPLTPRPEDEEAIQSWLQQCSETISQQLQLLIYEDSSSKPASGEPEGIDFETEISKEQMKPRVLGESNRKVSTETGWQNSFTVRLEDFEYIIDQNMTEFRDPQAKRLRSKWNQQFGSKSVENLRRCLMLPPLPVHLDQCLQRIRILRRPNRPKVEELRLRVEMNFCKMYCTLSMNMNLNLQNTARNLRNAVYNTDIDVIQMRYEATQIAWIWSNGSVLIINGRGHAMLAETQRDLMLRTLAKANFKAEPSNKLLHLRLISCAHFPWGISLPEFTASSVLSPESHMKYVYYVDKAIPGVAARVHETGMIQVFAMTTGEADNMLKKLYLLTANHRKATIDVFKKESIDYD